MSKVHALTIPAVVALVLVLCCHKSSGGNPDAGSGDSGPIPYLSSILVNDRFYVADHMRASLEMQISGEPFAQLLGYNLAGFDRTLTVTDQYFDPATQQLLTQPLGYALAVENYEYSKQPMNNISFESGAGLSLMFGPLLNPMQLTGEPAYELLERRFQLFGAEAGANLPGGLIIPAPDGGVLCTPGGFCNQTNFYGWPGLWPEFAEFADFDPTIDPFPGRATCTFSGSLGYQVGQSPDGGALVANYECDYNSLNLPDRDAQVNKTLDLAALGYVVWKQGLWSINYWGTLHDSKGNGITQVAPADQPLVGQPGNMVIGEYPNPACASGQELVPGAPGVFLGDIPMEGWQGLTMMEEIDNKSAFLLGSLLSQDGSTLTAPIPTLTADNYSYNSPILYFPGLVSVVETPTTSNPLVAKQFFPQPTSLSILDGTSYLRVLSGLIGGFAEAFAFTDRNNTAVGGSVPFLVTFDGDPFPMDDGKPDGENTLHDRALGIIKIALVDLDRLHFDTTHKVLADLATVSNGTITTGTTVTTVELAESILALRNAYRSLNGSLQLYSNDTPDSLQTPGALDSALLTAAPYSGTLQSHIIALIQNQAQFLSNQLISPSGAVANGYNLATNQADTGPTVLEAEAGAIRALLDAYLATNNESYRTQAATVYADLEQRFWMDDVQAYRTTAGIDDPMQYTPIRYGLLQGALRQYYKLVASQPGSTCGQPCDGGDLCLPSGINECEVLQRIKRISKLVLNGWNDRNQDNHIQYPEECMQARLQLAERALTGELGQPNPPHDDRDSDCVKEITYVYLPSALGAMIGITRQVLDGGSATDGGTTTGGDQ
jgi:hypothetical protein